MITAIELDFLRESNNIENEWDDKSLEDAIIAWQWIKNKKKLTRSLVLEVHEILMDTRDTIERKNKGAFRTGPVWIGGREAPKWFVIEELIANWLADVNSHIWSEDDDIPKEEHIAYEAIHPFVDGNGRTGRIFYNWQRVRLGLPIHVIHVGKEQQEYYKWFGKQR